MQLYVIDWSFQNAEDQLFATHEFCEYFKEGKISQNIDGFELNFIAHKPQNGSGIIICRAKNLNLLYKLFNMWRKNFSISFNFSPALTNEDLLLLHSDKCFWTKD